MRCHLTIFPDLFSHVSETFMGEGCQNNKRKVLSAHLYCFCCFQILLQLSLHLSVSFPIFPMPPFHLISLSFFRYDPEVDGRILLGKVDCTIEVDLCRRCSLQLLILAFKLILNWEKKSWVSFQNTYRFQWTWSIIYCLKFARFKIPRWYKWSKNWRLYKGENHNGFWKKFLTQ